MKNPYPEFIENEKYTIWESGYKQGKVDMIEEVESILKSPPLLPNIKTILNILKEGLVG